MIWALSYIAPMLLLFEHLALFCQLGVKYARYVSEVEKIMKDKKQYRGWAQICSSLVSESKNRTKNKVKNLFTCNSV